MWLIYFSFFFYLLIWMQVSYLGDLHSLAFVCILSHFKSVFTPWCEAFYKRHLAQN